MLSGTAKVRHVREGRAHTPDMQFLVAPQDGDKAAVLQPCVCVSTFELGHLQLFDLLQLVVALSVLVQLPVVVVALGLVLVLQVVVLLLQVLVLVLAEAAQLLR